MRVRTFSFKKCKNCQTSFSGYKASSKYCSSCKPKDCSGRGHTRHLVRARDHFTCRDCGLVRLPELLIYPEKNLDVHHLNGQCGKKTKGYDRIKDIPKLITLCHRCHFRRHDFSKKGKRAVQAYGTLRTSGKKKIPV